MKGRRRLARRGLVRLHDGNIGRVNLGWLSFHCTRAGMGQVRQLDRGPEILR